MTTDAPTIKDIYTGHSKQSGATVTIVYSDETEDLFAGSFVDCLRQIDFAFGRQAGAMEALAETGPLTGTREITYRPAEWVAGYRIGRAKIRRERHLASEDKS